MIKVGLMLYDLFTHGQGTVPTHKFYKREKALEEYPRLNPEIKYTATYYDGSILSPERLTLELILDAERKESCTRSKLLFSRSEWKTGYLER
jgi:glycerol-3-phosphate dehydrogenase